MKLNRSLSTLGMTLLLSVSVIAKPVPAPSLPVFSAITFGWVSMAGSDPTSDTFSSFAPTMLAITKAGYHSGFEAADGQLAFSGFHVDSNFSSALASVGSGAIRLSRFAYRSNEAPLLNGSALGLPVGALAKTRGEAYELAYAKDVGCVTVGASLVPGDNADISLSGHGMSMITGTVKTKFGGRIGTLVYLGKQLRVGADYSYQHGTGSAMLNPILVPGAKAWVTESDGFLTRVSTVGASWKVYPGTLIFVAYQDFLTKSEASAFRDHATEQIAGIQRNLAANLLVRVKYTGGGFNYGASWRTPIGIINAAYTHRALANAEYILGKGDAAFIGLAAAFK